MDGFVQLLELMVSDVMPDCLRLDVTDASGEFPRRPQMTLPERFLQIRESLAKFMGRPSFEELEGEGDAHIERQGYKQMDVVRSDVHVMDDDFVDGRGLNKRCFNDFC